MVMKESFVVAIDDFFSHGSIIANMVHVNKDNDNEQDSKESRCVFNLSGKAIELKKNKNPMVSVEVQQTMKKWGDLQLASQLGFELQ